MCDKAMDDIELTNKSIGLAEKRDSERGVPYPLVVPADDLRAHLIKR